MFTNVRKVMQCKVSLGHNALGMTLKNLYGQTPLPPELQKGLRHKHIQNMDELDEYEEANIAQGLAWLEKSHESCIHTEFWTKLHKRLFGDTWSNSRRDQNSPSKQSSFF